MAYQNGRSNKPAILIRFLLLPLLLLLLLLLLLVVYPSFSVCGNLMTYNFDILFAKQGLTET